MRNFKSWAILPLLYTLVACGGGGEEEAAPTAQPVATPPTASAPPPEPTSTSASDIAVPSGFDFKTSDTLSVMVSLNSSYPDSLFLTVCHKQSSTTSGANQSNYEDCLTRTRIADGQFEADLIISNDVDELIATLWSFDPVQVVKTSEWQRTASSTQQLLIAE
ncbi:MAG: hypothetical protein AAF465_15205 [Pseudomonadota bacterium]